MIDPTTGCIEICPWIKHQVCYDPATLAVLGTIGTTVMETAGTVAPWITAAGTAVGALGTIAAGKDAKRNAAYEKAQLDIQAKEAQAASQREAEQYRRRKDLALAEITNKAAASGFTATDPTALAIADDVQRYGTLQEQMAMYGGASRRAGLEAQGNAAVMEGDSKYRASKWSAASTILGGVGTLADKYAPKTAKSSSYRYGGTPIGDWKTTVIYG
jgi:hypothetical protein